MPKGTVKSLRKKIQNLKKTIDKQKILCYNKYIR